jgi:hypothetical protein
LTAAFAAAKPARAAAMFPLVTKDSQAVIVVQNQRDLFLPDTPPGASTISYYNGPEYPLQDYIEQSTGRKLQVVMEKDYNPATMPNAIFVGDTQKAEALFGDQLKKLEADPRLGYIVSVAPHDVVLAGPNQMWAQFDFLMNYLGVSTYFPAKNNLGTAVPKHQQVLVPVGTRIEQPTFTHRVFSTLNSWQNPNWAGIPWRFAYTLSFSHAINNYITVSEFGKTHPEYFGMKDGKRVIDSTSSAITPETANPAVAQIVIDKVLQQFQNNPRLKCISLAQTDGGFSDSPESKATDGPSIRIDGDTSSHSYRWFTFINKIAKAVYAKYPDRYIGVLAYQTTELPPPFKLEPNVIPFITETRGNWIYRGAKEFDLKLTAAWLKCAKHIGVYEYYEGMGYSTPNIYSHDIAEYLQFVAKHSHGEPLGFYTESYANWGLDGPKLWILEKLLWNPFQNVDQLRHQWCAAVFGPAAAPMEKYFSQLENARKQNAHLEGYKPGKMYGVNFPGIFGMLDDSRQFLLYTQHDINACLADIAEAHHLAKDNLTQQRIHYFATTFNYFVAAFKEYHAYKNIPALMNANTPARPLLKALLKDDTQAPPVSSAEIEAQLKREDPSMMKGGLALDTGSTASNKILNDIAMPVMHNALMNGETDTTKLAKLVKADLEKGVPPAILKSATVQKRVNGWVQMASRILDAKCVTPPPTINEMLKWPMQTDQPWWTYRQSMKVTNSPTELAAAYDDHHLYIAFKCHQSLDKAHKIDGYMSPGWRYTSLEFFINRDGVKDPNDYYQFIASYGGGFWEKTKGVGTYQASSGDDYYAGMVTIDLDKAGLPIGKNHIYRINFCRDFGTFGVPNQDWFPVSFANNDMLSRGWLVLK